MPRVLAIGDIHGCYIALRTLVENVPLADDDLLITLGDYVDRGPRSKDVLDWLIERHKGGNLIPLKGNHEWIMLKAQDDIQTMMSWFNDHVGGKATVDSYSPEDGHRLAQLCDIPEAHWDFLHNQTRRHHETDTHLFVHANALPLLPLNAQPDEYLIWRHLERESQQAHISGKTLICGHTAQRSGLPLDLGHTICIDTYAMGGGWLTCFEPSTRYCWQANERGEFREGELGLLGN
jgi:serine/threonine protein phosphatase 1